jgi:hypothetical protein
MNRRSTPTMALHGVNTMTKTFAGICFIVAYLAIGVTGGIADDRNRPHFKQHDEKTQDIKEHRDEKTQDKNSQPQNSQAKTTGAAEAGKPWQKFPDKIIVINKYPDSKDGYWRDGYWYPYSHSSYPFARYRYEPEFSAPAVSYPAAQVATRTCLTKEYLQTGTVLFKDVCTKEWALNSNSVATQVASSNRNCLTKENLRSSVTFKDVCTGEWAVNPPEQQTQGPQPQ